MHQQHQTVESIIRSLIASNRHSQQELSCCCNKSSAKKAEVHSQSQELLIDKEDLRVLIVRMMAQKEQQNSTIELKDLQIAKLKDALQSAQQKAIELLKSSSIPLPQKGDLLLKKSLQQLQRKMEQDKKKRQQLQKEAKWNQSKIKEQVIELQKLKHTIGARQGFIKSLVSQRKKEINTQKSIITRLQEQVKTPVKMDSTRIELNSSLNRQTVQSNKFQAIEPHKFQIKDTKTGSKFIESRFPSTDREEIISNRTPANPKIRQFEPQQDFIQSNIRKNEQTFYRHSSELDKQNTLLKKLAEKCIFLESYIQTLTKKLLGYQGQDKLNEFSPPKKDNNKSLPRTPLPIPFPQTAINRSSLEKRS